MLKRKTKTPESRLKVATSINGLVVLREDPEQLGENVRHSSVARTSLQKEQPSSRLASKFRRSSAKLLSRLGLWSSGNYEHSATEFSNPVDTSFPCASNASDRELDSLQAGHDSMYSSKYSDETPVKLDYYQAACSASHTEASVPETDGLSKGRPEIGHSVYAQLDRIDRNPILPRRFSQKLSIFGPQTVIRRSRAKVRQGIVNMDGSCPVVSHNKWDGSILGSTEPSAEETPVFSQTDCCSSLDGVSTSFTVLSSGYEDSAQRLWAQSSRSAPTIQSATTPKIIPSIVTVETTAAAKVFFETHFNSIHLTQDNRNQRLQELDERLCELPFTNEERIARRKAWELQESEYLRQSRVLRTRSNRFHSPDTISSAGYEIIRVLGQGSFGIVQLVKEKNIGQDLSNRGRDSSTVLDGLKGSRYGRRFTTRSSHASDSHTSRKNVQRRMQGNVYAMKVIRKADMVRLCQEGHIRAEREFLTASERSKWIVPLIASFQDASHLYLVMEYEVGGDFFGLLVRHGVLSERDTMWYVAEMIICVEEAHRLGWIHRDVKPENFLISASGHLKLADFGLAFDGHWSHNQAYFNNHRYSLISKLGIDIQGDTEDQSESHKSQQSDSTLLQQNEKDSSLPRDGEPMLDWRDRNGKRRFARSIVGTSQYMAPEIISGELYDGRCDYWSIGIILYECLYGVTPFYRENRDETKRYILHHRLTLSFPEERLSDLIVSYHAIDLIQQLLQRKEFRLSSSGYKTNNCALWHGMHNTIYANAIDPRTSRYKGNHVYSDDASDIKAHRFFRQIPWGDMLRHRPPYVPEANIWEDANYSDGENLDFLNPIIPQANPQLMEDASMAGPNPPTPKMGGADNQNTVMRRKNKEKKRARDKILRDAIVGPTALDLRTKAAFVGYTWRRPKSVRDVLEIERGRSLLNDRY